MILTHYIIINAFKYPQRLYFNKHKVTFRPTTGFFCFNKEKRRLLLREDSFRVSLKRLKYVERDHQ